MKKNYTPPVVETVSFGSEEPIAAKTSLNFSDFFPKSTDDNKNNGLSLKDDNSNT